MTAVVALAGVEGRRLVVHPVVLAAVVLSVLQAVANIAQTDATNVAWLYLGWFVLLSCGALVATNLAALRTRRARTDELFASVPLSVRRQTTAHLLALAWAVAASAAVLVAFTACVHILTDKTVAFGDSESPIRLAIGLAEAPLLVALFGALGVALARWIPHALVAPIAVVALLAAGIATGSGGSAPRWLAPIAAYNDLSAEPASAWRLLYLAGLVLVVASVALRRHGRDRGIVLAGLAGAASAVAAAAAELA